MKTIHKMHKMSQQTEFNAGKTRARKLPSFAQLLNVKHKLSETALSFAVKVELSTCVYFPL